MGHLRTVSRTRYSAPQVSAPENDARAVVMAMLDTTGIPPAAPGAVCCLESVVKREGVGLVFNRSLRELFPPMVSRGWMTRRRSCEDAREHPGRQRRGNGDARQQLRRTTLRRRL